MKGKEQLAWEQGVALGGVALEVSVGCLSQDVQVEVGPVGVELRGRGRCELEGGDLGTQRRDVRGITSELNMG